MLKTEKILQFLRQKSLDVRGASFQRKSLRVKRIEKGTKERPMSRKTKRTRSVDTRSKLCMTKSYVA